MSTREPPCFRQPEKRASSRQQKSTGLIDAFWSLTTKPAKALHPFTPSPATEAKAVQGKLLVFILFEQVFPRRISNGEKLYILPGLQVRLSHKTFVSSTGNAFNVIDS
jgi:hypothetical protein